jgi:hypothetical protein
MKKAYLSVFAAAAVLCGLLLVQGCSTSGPLSDVSKDIALLAVSADRQAVDSASDAVDESSVASESGGSKSMMAGAPGARALVSAEVTVLHSDPNYAMSGKTAATLAVDVVTVTRSWTAADGAIIVDVVQRPEVPSQAGFYSAPVLAYTPNIATDADLAWKTADSSYELTCSQSRRVDGVLVSNSSMRMRYVWDAANDRAALTTVTKEGESVSLLTGNARLDTTIHYAYDSEAGKDVEFLRVVDWVTGSGVQKREVLAFGLDAASALAIPAASGSWSGTVALLPGLDTILGSGSSLDLIYWTDPSAASYSLVAGNTATYPVIDAGLWLRVVTSPASPRDVHWLKPIANSSEAFDGNYTRRLEIVKDGAQIATTTYSLSDGVTVVRTGSAIRFVSAADGAVTTKWSFADGKARNVTIQPTEDGFTITRSTNSASQTYTVSYLRDTSGEITSVTVTNTETGVASTYVEQSDGTWALQP